MVVLAYTRQERTVPTDDEITEAEAAGTRPYADLPPGITTDADGERWMAPAGQLVGVPIGHQAVLVPDHGNPEVRAMAGCIELLAMCSPRGRSRVLHYLREFCDDPEAGGSPLRLTTPADDDEPF